MKTFYQITGKKTQDGWMYTKVRQESDVMYIWCFVLKDEGESYLYNYVDYLDHSSLRIIHGTNLDMLYTVYVEALVCLHYHRIIVDYTLDKTCAAIKVHYRELWKMAAL